MNLSSNEDLLNLVNLFPLIRRGFALRSTVTALLHVYGYINDLIHKKQITPDQLMIQAFSETFKGFQLFNSSFKVDIFPVCFLASIVAINQLPLIDPIDSLQVQLLVEDALAKIIYDGIIDTKSTDIYSLVQFSLRVSSYSLINALRDHPKINKLYISILLGNTQDVKTYAKIIDPRSYSYRAYLLASSDILDVIEREIIQRNLIEQAVFDRQIAIVIGCSTNLPQIIYNYCRSLMRLH